VNTLELMNQVDRIWTDESMNRQVKRTYVSVAEAQWSHYLHETYTPRLSDEQAELLFSKAWENGHAYGYAEVENEYIDLADWLKRFMKAGN